MRSRSVGVERVENRLPAMRWSWSDEVAVLEEALQQAIARQGTAENMQGYASSPRTEALDSALASYGMKLRAWLDVQVDARLSQILPDLMEGELATVRAEWNAVLDAVESVRQKTEADTQAVAEAQGKLLQVVDGMSRELARWKADRGAEQKTSQAVVQARNSSHDSRQLELSSEVKRLKEQISSMERQLVSEDESVRELTTWAQRRFARVHELEKKMADLERRVSSRRDELKSDLTIQASSSARSEFEIKLQGLREDLKGQLEARVGVLRDWCESSKQEQDSRIRSIRGDLGSKAEAQVRALERQLESRLACQVTQLEAIEEKLQSELRTVRSECCQEMQNQLEGTRAHLGEDLASLQQRLVSELRAETMAAIGRDSASIASLDEQLWISDQRLSRRIDELVYAQLHRRGSQNGSKTYSENAPAPVEPTPAERRKSSSSGGVLATAQLAAKTLLRASREEEEKEEEEDYDSRPRRIAALGLSAQDSRDSACRKPPASRSARSSWALDGEGERTSQTQERSESCRAGTRRSGRGVLAMVAKAAEAFAENGELDG